MATMDQRLASRPRHRLHSVLILLLSGFLFLLSVVPPLQAAITSSGNISPALPWTSSTICYVGNTSDGSLTINGGSDLQSKDVYIGYAKGVTGSVSLSGTGSTWTISTGTVYVGMNGNGTLTIASGAQFNLYEGNVSLGWLAGSTGTVTVTGPGSVFDAGSYLTVGSRGSGSLTVTDGGKIDTGVLLASLADLHGNGIITTSGAVLDADLRFDASHATQQSISFGNGGTLTIDVPYSAGYLGAGYKGNGSLTIAEGITINSLGSTLGYCPGSVGIATVTGSGSKWISSSDLYVGRSGSGTLNIEAGAEVSNTTGYLGHDSGTTGTAKINGLNSKWTNSGILYVGKNGSGTLNVEAGAQVSNTTGYLGFYSNTTGTATVTGLGSKWTNSSELYIGYYGSGTLNIEAGAQVSDTKGYLGSKTSTTGTGTATVRGSGSKWINSNELYIGYSGSGTLNIEDGAQVSNTTGYLGYYGSANGTATVTGFGSKWTNSSDLYIGGTLDIQAGAQVSNARGFIVDSPMPGRVRVSGIGSKWSNNSSLEVGSHGACTLNIEAGAVVSNTYGFLMGKTLVTGFGSKWTNSSSLNIGGAYNGTLHIRDGGVVSAILLSINSGSVIDIDVGSGSAIRVGGSGTGTITNNYMVSILAGPTPDDGQQFSPLVAGTWSGSGTYQTLGGTWNATSHVFTASSTLAGVVGSPVTIDFSKNQRILVKDSAGHEAVGASFLARTIPPSSIKFTVSSLSSFELNSLQALLPSGQSILSAWGFTTSGTGLFAYDPIYLSFGIPLGYSRDDIHIWRNSSGWSNFGVDDLTSIDGYASFTSTGLSHYAIVGIAPATWKVDADGLWQTGSNWTTAPTAPGGVNKAAILGLSITAPRTVTLSGSLTLGMLTLNSTQHYTLAGSDAMAIQVNPGYDARIDVQASDAHGHVIETPITLLSPLEISIAPSALLTLAGQIQNPTGQTMTLSGGGTLTVTQGIVTTGTINVQAGTLITPSLTADTLTIGAGLSSNLAAVPEPGSIFLLLAAMIGFTGCSFFATRKSSAKK